MCNTEVVITISSLSLVELSTSYLRFCHCLHAPKVYKNRSWKIELTVVGVRIWASWRNRFCQDSDLVLRI